MAALKDKGENIFTRINTRKLRERAFSKLSSEASRASVKIKGGDTYKLQMQGRNGKQVLAELRSPDEEFEDQGMQNVIFSFDIGPEKFFMQTSAEITSARFIKIQTTSELFKLQRRRNFRVELPRNYEPQIYIDSIEGATVDHDFIVNDLSLGGLSFDIPMDSPLAVEIGDYITGRFRMEEGALVFPFKANIKHIMNIGSMGSGIKRAGIEFVPLDTATENQMLEVLMRIQKDVIGMLASSDDE
jgi:c-di-GMP-binding flagellar brake protein YcgR